MAKPGAKPKKLKLKLTKGEYAFKQQPDGDWKPEKLSQEVANNAIDTGKTFPVHGFQCRIFRYEVSPGIFQSWAQKAIPDKPPPPPEEPSEPPVAPEVSGERPDEFEETEASLDEEGSEPKEPSSPDITFDEPDVEDEIPTELIEPESQSAKLELVEKPAKKPAKKPAPVEPEEESTLSQQAAMINKVAGLISR